LSFPSSHAFFLTPAPNAPRWWRPLPPSNQFVVRPPPPPRRIWEERRWRIIVNASDATTRIGQLLTSFDRRPQVSFRCLSSQPIIIRLKVSGCSTLQKWRGAGAPPRRQNPPPFGQAAPRLFRGARYLRPPRPQCPDLK